MHSKSHHSVFSLTRQGHHALRVQGKQSVTLGEAKVLCSWKPDSVPEQSMDKLKLGYQGKGTDQYSDSCSRKRSSSGQKLPSPVLRWRQRPVNELNLNCNQRPQCLAEVVRLLPHCVCPHAEAAPRLCAALAYTCFNCLPYTRSATQARAARKLSKPGQWDIRITCWA